MQTNNITTHTQVCFLNPNTQAQEIRATVYQRGLSGGKASLVAIKAINLWLSKTGK